MSMAQPPCTSNPVANDFCSNATPICNLNGYCGNTSSFYTDWVSSTNHTSEDNTPLGNVFCATIQNNSWLKFIADSTVAVFSVWVSNCTNNHGIQMQIYSTTDCYHYTAVSNCWNPMLPTNGQIIATNLTPGNVYYFMIDGTMGDVCDYVIAANVGVSSTPTLTSNQSICKGDSLTLTASGGSTFNWTSFPSDISLNTSTTQSSVKVKPLVSTLYRVIVTKSGSNAFCPNNIDTLYTYINVKPIPVLNLQSTPDNCGMNDGTANVNVMSGSGVYSYLWNTNPVQTNANAINLHSGYYKVKVTDSTGCYTMDSIYVASDTVLHPDITGQNFLCQNTTTVLNAGSNYSTYLWSNGATSQNITIASGGTYFVMVTKNTCKGYDTIVVQNIILQPPLIIGPEFICYGDTAYLNAGSGFSSYHWSNNQNTQTAMIISGGNYSVTVSDTNGCTIIATFSILQKYGPILTFTTTNEICDRNDGTATVLASGGQGTYTYLWNNSENTISINGLPGGIYSVSVKDSLCETKADVIVHETPGPKANFVISPYMQVYIDEPVSFNFKDESIGNILMWYWNFDDGTNLMNQTNFVHQYNSVGNYNVTLTVTDNNLCIDSISKIVIVRDIFTFYIPNAFSPNDDGINDVFTPKGTNVEPGSFEMYIYNRWGNLIFQTKNWYGNTSEPWDGSYNNNGVRQKVNEDTYAYKIYVKELGGITHQYVGIITVLR